MRRWTRKIGGILFRIWTAASVVLVVIDVILRLRQGQFPAGDLLLLVLVGLCFFVVVPWLEHKTEEVELGPLPLRKFAAKVEELEQASAGLTSEEFQARFNQVQKDWYAMQREMARIARTRYLGPFTIKLTWRPAIEAEMNALFDRLKAIYLRPPAP